MNYIADHIKAVLFDHDDTLVGTMTPKWAHHKHVAKTFYHKELTDADIRPHWGKPFREMICLLYGTDDVEQAVAYNTSCHEAYPKELFTATIPTLKRLKEQGMKLGIITATVRYSFEHDLDLHKIPREVLDYTQTSEDTDYHKPDSRVFAPVLKWLQTEHIAPHEVLYVGDGLHDHKAATGAGFNFLGVQTGLITAEEFAKNDIVSITSLDELAPA